MWAGSSKVGLLSALAVSIWRKKTASRAPGISGWAAHSRRLDMARILARAPRLTIPGTCSSIAAFRSHPPMSNELSNRPGAAGEAAGSDPWEARAVPAALALLAALLLQGLIFIGESSQTSDEAAHIAAGYSYLQAADFRLNPAHPPPFTDWA